VLVFATLLGALPVPPLLLSGGDGTSDASGVADAAGALRQVIEAQETAGLEPLTDARAPADPGPDVVARWRAAAGLTDRAVKAALRGPWSAAIDGGAAAGSAGSLEADVLARAERLHEQIVELAAAGCPLVEIVETEAHRIGSEDAARRVFREAHVRLAGDMAGTHLSLSIVGGSAWEAGAATILDAPYQSLAVDLIAGPDNWRLVTATPRERGIVAGALPTGAGADEGPELLVWAAHYAASTGGRGLARVGLGTAGSLAALSWAQATTRLRTLGDAARIAALPAGELADALDPRAVSSRAAALGRTSHASSHASGRASRRTPPRPPAPGPDAET